MEEPERPSPVTVGGGQGTEGAAPWFQLRDEVLGEEELGLASSRRTGVAGLRRREVGVRESWGWGGRWGNGTMRVAGIRRKPTLEQGVEDKPGRGLRTSLAVEEAWRKCRPGLSLDFCLLLQRLGHSPQSLTAP